MDNSVTVSLKLVDGQQRDFIFPLDVPVGNFMSAITMGNGLLNGSRSTLTLYRNVDGVLLHLKDDVSLGEAGVMNGDYLELRKIAEGEHYTNQMGKAMLCVHESKHSFRIHKELIVLGRYDLRHNIIPDIDLTEFDIGKTVSRRHCSISFVNDQFEIIDLNSANGTYINSQKIDSEHPRVLVHADMIQFGKEGMNLIFSIGDTPILG
jgi:hypothetical protein